MVYPRIPRWHAIVPAAFVALPLLVVGCAARGPAETTADPSAETEAPAGIFTESQADCGRASFGEHRAECHTDNEFRDRLFQSNWGRRTVYSFYRTTRSTMPDNNPGELEEQVYLDVVSYILSLNGHEAGTSELPTDSPMRQVRIALASEG